ncbi:MAG: hypothetical protein JJE35_07550 [Thermoleophilia bacterium]|nr:hypothetical protein [Thermoleophilia bacterium]
MKRLTRDQRGTTLVELVVGMASGLVVMVGLTTLILVTLHTTSRVSARVDATQTSRLTLNRVIDQLHSACIAPKVPPIRKESSSTELRFIHAPGSAVAPVPTLTTITYSAGALTQSDYDWKEGTAPFWVFKTTPSRTIALTDRVAPITGKPIFSYHGYVSGTLSTTTLTVPLSELDASRTIHVTVAFMATPRNGNSEEATPARIQGSATLRLTASSYNPAAPSLPCQ